MRFFCGTVDVDATVDVVVDGAVVAAAAAVAVAGSGRDGPSSAILGRCVSISLPVFDQPAFRKSRVVFLVVCSQFAMMWGDHQKKKAKAERMRRKYGEPLLALGVGASEPPKVHYGLAPNLAGSC